MRLTCLNYLQAQRYNDTFCTSTRMARVLQEHAVPMQYSCRVFWLIDTAKSRATRTVLLRQGIQMAQHLHAATNGLLPVNSPGARTD